MKLNDPLHISKIDFRVQSINKGGYATILAYKDARVDMERLDEVYGPEGWQRKHEFKEGRLYCSVGIYSEKIGQWVWKEDIGTESNADSEKGQASDSFKRACVNFGIGREIYGYPIISIKLEASTSSKPEYGEWYLQNNKAKNGYGLKLKEWKWYSEFEDGKISFLAAQDNNGKTRFTWGKRKESKS